MHGRFVGGTSSEESLRLDMQQETRKQRIKFPANFILCLTVQETNNIHYKEHLFRLHVIE